MTSKSLAFAVVVLALAAPVAARAEDRMSPGLWEITAAVEVPGMAAAIPPTSQTECLSQKDVDAEPVPELDKGACRATDIRRSGGKVTWNLVCAGSKSASGRGEITVTSPTAYDGWITMDAGGAEVRLTIRARRVGGC